MCTQLFFPTREVETVGQLRELIGDEPIAVAYAESLTDDECLCSVDVESTLKRHGFSFRWNPCGYDVDEKSPPHPTRDATGLAAAIQAIANSERSGHSTRQTF